MRFSPQARNPRRVYQVESSSELSLGLAYLAPGPGSADSADALRVLGQDGFEQG
jgi:hypothetical protein